MNESPVTRRWPRFLWQLPASACLGLATVALVVPAVFSVFRGGGECCFCAYFVAFPVAGASIGWLLPRVCPAASIAAAIFIAATLPPGIGPTSKTMNPVFAVTKGLGMFAGEIAAAAIRLARDAKARRETPLP